jgi:hypothetical protein
VCLTIGPAFLSAAIYLSLSRLIVIYGAHIAPFAPKTYSYVFIGCDVISLILQATGGALAASADTKSAQNTGVNVMIAGLVFQVASIGLFMVLSLDFLRRVKRARSLNKDPKFEELRARSYFKFFPFGMLYHLSWMSNNHALFSSLRKLTPSLCTALAFAIMAIFIRCVYRVAELHGGFGGKLANDQVTFLILEGPFIMAAGLSLVIFHPGVCLSGAWKAAGWGKAASAAQKSRADHQNVATSGVTSV